MIARFLASFTSFLLLATSAWALGGDDFVGKPSGFAAGEQTGVAIWNDGKRLFVQFASKGEPREFGGKVCAKSQVQNLLPNGLEGGDSIKLGPEGRCIWIKLSVESAGDGFSLDLPASTVIFDLRMGKQQLGAAQIWVGRAGLHPESSPFAFTPKQP